MKVTNAGETTSKEVQGPNEIQEIMNERKAARKRELAGHTSVFGKIKRLFKSK